MTLGQIQARLWGDDYQALLFWREAVSLLAPQTKVAEIAFENGLSPFDDLHVLYGSERSTERGDLIRSDLFQAKYSVDYQRRLGFRSLTDPSFFGTKQSLLQRMKLLADSGDARTPTARMNLEAVYGLEQGDPLEHLISRAGGEIRLGTLFSPSATKDLLAVRSAWREHLELNDQELESLLRPLRIRVGATDFRRLATDLSIQLQSVGVNCASEDEVDAFLRLYLRLVKEGRNHVDRQLLLDFLTHANLLLPKQEESPWKPIGIKSFSLWTRHLDDFSERVLSLLEYFDDRMLRPEFSWNKHLLPAIRNFLESLSNSESYAIYLETHSSIAFAVGHHVGLKSGLRLVPMQNGRTGRHAWDPSGPTPERTTEEWQVITSAESAPASELVVAISVSQDVLAQVEAYVSASEHLTGARVIHLRLPSLGGTAISDANHALHLAQSAVQLIRANTKGLAAGRPTVHLLIAAPNGFTFFLGQESRPLGEIQLYEFDFELHQTGTYTQSFVL
jgi:hypothetical protein